MIPALAAHDLQSTTAGTGGAGRRRFVAPARGQFDPARFDHPIYAGLGDYRDLLASAQWPSIEQINQCICVLGKRFVAQDEVLLSDCLHYETRIAQGHIATRPQNWHDLFNALVWGRYPALKRALNARQCEAIAHMGTRQRNAAQQALTQFDESGVVLRVRDAAFLAAWDRHEWQGLFVDQAPAWRCGDIAVAATFGHALLEQALLPGRRLVGKALVVLANDDATALACVADAISRGAVLQQAAELRPLPLAGIPGWQSAQDDDFYADADYFRPLREGRIYPPALPS